VPGCRKVPTGSRRPCGCLSSNRAARWTGAAPGPDAVSSIIHVQERQAAAARYGSPRRPRG
jgi:hypothetical protein